MIPFTYLTSFIFQSPPRAQMINFFFHFLFGSIVVIAMWVLRVIPSTRSAGKLVCWILRIIPSFSFGMGIMNMANRALYQVVEGYAVQEGVFDFDISGGDILYLGVEGFVFFFLIFIVEYLSHVQSITQMFSNENSVAYVQQPKDDDVLKEELECETAKPEDYSVLVRKLRKVYKKNTEGFKVAVD